MSQRNDVVEGNSGFQSVGKLTARFHRVFGLGPRQASAGSGAQVRAGPAVSQKSRHGTARLQVRGHKGVVCDQGFLFLVSQADRDPRPRASVGANEQAQLWPLLPVRTGAEVRYWPARREDVHCEFCGQVISYTFDSWLQEL